MANMALTIEKIIKPITKKAIDIIFPPRCLSCKVYVESDGSLCHNCWEEIDFISSPQCSSCGTPLEFATSDGTICGQCIANPPKYTMARSVLRYNEKSSKLITNFKYYDNTHSSNHFAKWLLRAGKDMIGDVDIITPVPLHKLRLLSRRYNQCALICNRLSEMTGITSYNNLLIRHKNTKPQAGLAFNKRINNVKSAFKINHDLIEQINDKNILLIDDVMTTGSTIDSCTKTLLNSGARNVYVLTIAMTVKD